MEIRLIATLFVVCTTPGAALLALSPLWDHWRGLARVVVMISLSLAFYPVLFYTLDVIPITIRLGPYTMAVFLALCWVVIGIKRRSQLKTVVEFDTLEWYALIIIVITLFTRLWVAHQNPYPAWVDSIHHVMLTKLIVTNGMLPHSLEPYYPVPLSMYHLGLHSLSAVVAWLAQCEIHTALLWTAQTLNGLCGIGLYLMLDRKVGRVAALTGVAVVGLFSYQPAFYVNWGRFTQIASQSLILTVWIVTYETIQTSNIAWASKKQMPDLLWLIVLSALLGAGMLLYHFRIAILYFFLLIPSLLYLVIQHYRTDKKIRNPLLATFSIALCTLLFVAPSLWDAIIIYLHIATVSPPSVVTLDQYMQTGWIYFATPLQAIFELIGQRWLLYTWGVGLIFGLLNRNKMIILSLIWVIALTSLSNLYLLAIRSLGVVNFSGVAIMFYLPIGIVLGTVAQYVIDLMSPVRRHQIVLLWALTITLLSIPFAWQRLHQLEPYRFLMTDQDRIAMGWIDEHIAKTAQFAINTEFWLPVLPHGIDAGYWIPYFTERSVSTAPMLASLAEQKYQNEWIETSRLVIQINDNPTVLSDLYHRGVHYVYIGAKGHYTPGKGLDASKLKNYNQLKLVYEKDGVTIFEILPPK